MPRARSKASSKQPPARLPALSLDSLAPEQQSLVDAIKSGPRGQFNNEGPFAAFLHAPAYGVLAQKLGGHLRFNTCVPPRLSEFAILCTGQFWKAQYEWYAHAAIAAKQGVKEATIRDLKAGRAPKSAPRDEMAIYAFVKELYAARRVSNATYARVHKFLGDAGMVELVGILGYYVLISMTLDVFRMPLPEGAALPFKEPGKS
ncbi:MAG: carboxymuconolactone decarboxylase family protein [Xanthobacteraceae bacterium]